MLEVSILGAGTMLRLERTGCVVNVLLTKASNKCVYAPPRHSPLPPPSKFYFFATDRAALERQLVLVKQTLAKRFLLHATS